jgi:PTH2 family peptidyl-tRNA hydrolase
MSSDVKQVIVIRKDLHMRRGKEIAQGAHAAMAFMSRRIQSGSGFTPLQMEWIKGRFAKVCLQCDSEKELLDLYNAAKAAGIEANLIIDAGLTEFDGQETKTCIAIGPDKKEKIDKITGHLRLY